LVTRRFYLQNQLKITSEFHLEIDQLPKSEAGTIKWRQAKPRAPRYQRALNIARVGLAMKLSSHGTDSLAADRACRTPETAWAG